ncbi:PBP1A family penicillin-binding protein [Candidatus Microgenomates bacterium]|nr:PBP1A family penicillin-binding protein [Candidatus Microgenomates bacterium]
MARGPSIFAINKFVRFLLLFIVLFLIGTFSLFIFYAKDLPQPGKLTSREVALSTRIFDRNGQLLFDIFGSQDRTYVPLAEISQHLKNATIAIEDKEFFTHEGFSITGYLRVIRDVVLYHRLSGGSTLTQQLIKNVFLSPERTIPRKIKEFILAIQVENSYDKNQILELYLNEAPYGGTALGVEAASQTYFGKKAKDLDLLESAILAGLPQRPSTYSPYGQDSKAYIKRTEQVLRRMREDGYITLSQEEEAKKKLPDVSFKDKGKTIKAAHFVFFVKEFLIDKFGEDVVESGGLQVTTTLDYDLQEKAEQIVKEEVEKAKSARVGNGAAIVIDSKNGEILSMVGSKEYSPTEEEESKDTAFEGKFNVVTAGLRQPGSAIKPVTYATALKKGYTAATLLYDTPTVFPVVDQKDYLPANYDGKFHGPMQMRFALGSSINLPAVKMVAKVGIKDMLITAGDLGIKTLAPTQENLRRLGLSVTLGGGEVRLIDLAAGYGAFSNGGYRVDPIAVLKVTDARGKTILEEKPRAQKRVLDQGIAFIVSNMLSDNNARLITFGPNSFLNIAGRAVAVKTGTTDDKRDNWTIGWTPSYVAGVWVGNNDNSEMTNVASGVTGAAPIWRRIILELLKDKPREDFVQPDNVVSMEVDAFGGGLPVEGREKRTEYFLKGTEPQTKASIYQRLKVSKTSGKLANAVEIAAGDYEERDFVVFSEEDLVSTDGKNRWQEGINKWLEENYKDDPLYHPPTETSSAKYDQVVIKFIKPADKSRINDNDVDLEIETAAAKSIVKITLFVDGKEKKIWEKSSVKEKVNINNGSHKLKARARDSEGREGETEITIGVNADANSPTPTP